MLPFADDALRNELAVLIAQRIERIQGRNGAARVPESTQKRAAHVIARLSVIFGSEGGFGAPSLPEATHVPRGVVIFGMVTRFRTAPVVRGGDGHQAERHGRGAEHSEGDGAPGKRSFCYTIWQACVTHGACYALRW